MSRLAPILTVLLGIVAIWYLAAVWMNSTWVYDQAERAGTTVSFAEMVPQTMDQDGRFCRRRIRWGRNCGRGCSGRR